MSEAKKNQGAGFVINKQSAVKEIYADSISGVAMGVPTTKLLLTTTNTDTGPNEVEVRDPVARLCIPTVVLLEFCTNYLISHSENKEQFDLAWDQAVAHGKSISSNAVSLTESIKES